LWWVRKRLLLPQGLYDSTKGFRAFPLIFLECSRYPFTRKVYLSYCTRLLLAPRFVLKVKTTDDENLKHSQHLFFDIEVFSSFSSLSYDRSKASSKASSPHSAIQSFLF
jgi:hypothetical protein